MTLPDFARALAPNELAQIAGRAGRPRAATPGPRCWRGYCCRGWTWTRRSVQRATPGLRRPIRRSGGTACSDASAACAVSERAARNAILSLGIFSAPCSFEPKYAICIRVVNPDQKGQTHHCPAHSSLRAAPAAWQSSPCGLRPGLLRPSGPRNDRGETVTAMKVLSSRAASAAWRSRFCGLRPRSRRRAAPRL